MAFITIDKINKEFGGLRRVLVITALPLELKAVVTHVQILGSCAARDGNIYEVGRFIGSSSEWLVIIGECGAGNLQSNSMVSTAANDFGEFDLIVFVGVAATRKKLDAPIGSVVVANHVYLAGVGKYDSGEFFPRSRDIPVDTRLQGLARKIARDEHWHERLKPPYGGIMPGHKHYPEPFPPGAIVAPIVSVEAVSADANSVLEKQITHSYQDATALEMEGYGAAFAAYQERTPLVVVRGISDAREGKEPGLDKIHQPIAAAHGAAFGFELIDLWGAVHPPTRTESQESLTALSMPLKLDDVSGELPNTKLSDESSRASDSDHAEYDNIVLSFEGSAADFTTELRDRVISFIRAETGNPNIKYIREEYGSYHLFVAVKESDREYLENAKFAQKLLESCGVHLVAIRTEAAFIDFTGQERAIKSASAALINWPRALPDGSIIERPELKSLLSIIDENEHSVTALIGAPGAGKTALLSALAHELEQRHIPFLAVKADILGVDVSTEEHLQEALSLPLWPSDIILRKSTTGPVILLIDQLDALAGYVDIKTGRLNVLLNLIRKVAGNKNVHIVVSARAFEYEHDARLKSINAEALKLELPAWSSVLKILSDNDISAAGWPADAQEVMRSPQALSTLLRLAPKAIEPFATYHAALEELWAQRVLRRPDGPRLAAVLGQVSDDMAEAEVLWLAAARYDSYSTELQTLVSEGILTNPAGNPGSIGFSHQTVFEFALARSFAQKRGRLSSYVLEREDSLFVRPKLWATLNYLRSVETETYLSELRAIWCKNDLRAHIRYLLVEFLGQQNEPSDAEAIIFNEALATPDRRAALMAQVGSRGWFARLGSSAIPAAMLDERDAGIAATTLMRAAEFAPTEVAALINKNWLPEKGNDQYIWSVIQEVKAWNDDYFDIFKIIIERSDFSPFAVEYLVSSVGVDQPAVALKLVAAYLRHALQVAKKEANRRALAQQGDEQSDERLLSSPQEAITAIVEEPNGWDTLEAIATAAPEEFIKQLWPWFVDVLNTLIGLEDGERDRGYAVRYKLDFRFAEEEDTLQLGEHPMLAAFRTAVETLAERDGEAFSSWVAEAQNVAAEPAQRLLAHAFACQPERLASLALKFLLGDERRFQLGNMEDYAATSKRLVRSTNAFWSDTEFEAFISAIRAYAPKPGSSRSPKSRQYFHRDTARLRVELLEALEGARVPDSIRNFVEEERRRLGYDKRGATFTGATWIGSSMSAEEIGRASDDDVVNAFRELPDATGWDNPKTWQKGGNIQLSRSFAEFAKSNPTRADAIIRSFDPAIGTRAAAYATEAMAESASPALVIDLIHDLIRRGFSGEEFRAHVARAVEKLLDRDAVIASATEEILLRWIAEPRNQIDASDSDDADDGDEFNSDEIFTEVTRSEPKQSESILWGQGGLSVLPGGNYPLLETIIRINLKNNNFDRIVNILSEHLNRSESDRVWTALLRFMPYIRPDNNADFESFLIQLLERYPAAAESHEAAMLVGRTYRVLPNLAQQSVKLWSQNAADIPQQMAGELATLIWLICPEYEWVDPVIAEILSSGSQPALTGAAYAAIHVLAENENTGRAAHLIKQIIQAGGNEAWDAIIDIFRLIDDVPPEPAWVDVLDAIAAEIPYRPQFRSSFVAQALQSLLPHQASLVARFTTALVSKWSDDLADLRTGTASIAPELVDIAITLHRLGSETRLYGLEIFEKLLALNAYTARETLNQIDNRFSAVAPQRIRLPRRKRRPRRGKRAAG